MSLWACAPARSAAAALSACALVGLAGLLGALGLAVPGRAAPLVPAGDDVVVEMLPGGAARVEARRLRRELAAQPADAARAVRLARSFLDEARATGDPRLAGQALAALRPWQGREDAPAEVLLMQATLAQHLHDFESAAGLLERTLARDPARPQAWLTLATVRRVQGRYDLSDQACEGLERIGGAFHGAACRAENDALRGRFDPARAVLRRLLAPASLDAGSRGWLLTTLAELEERAGRAPEADAAYRAALSAADDAYARVAYADFLIHAGRERDALALLRGRPATDAVLLRRAVAAARIGAPEAAADGQALRERIAQANLRPSPHRPHAREQAMFALWVERDARSALALARDNVAMQREPVDLLVLAQAARALGDVAARAEARRLAGQMNLVDRRLDALL